MNKFVVFLLLATVAGFSLSAQRLETVVQKGHELAVLDVVVSNDSAFVLTGSRDRTARLWHYPSGREVRTFFGHKASVTATAFSASGEIVITGSNDKRVRLFETKSGKEIYASPEDDLIMSVVADPLNRFYAYGGYSSRVTIRDISSHKVIHTIPVNPNKGTHSGVWITLSSDGQWMAIGEDNRTVNLYRTNSWEHVRKFEFEEGWCGGCGSAALFSADSRFLYVLQRNGWIKKFDLASFRAVQTYASVTDRFAGFALSPNGKNLAVANENAIFIFDEATAKKIDSVQVAGDEGFNKISFSKDSKFLLIANNNNAVTIWNCALRSRDRSLSGFLAETGKGTLDYNPNDYWTSHIAMYVRLKNDLLVTPDGKSLVNGNFGTNIRRWDIASGKGLMEYAGHSKAALCYAFSADGKSMVSGGADGKLIFWDVQTGDTLRVIDSYREPVFDVHFSNDGNRVISSSWEGYMKIHDVATGNRLHLFELDKGSAFSIVSHPNDLYIFAARLNKTLEMYEVDTKTVVRSFTGHSEIVSDLKVTRDGKHLLSSSHDGTVRLWDVGTGLMVRKIIHTDGQVHVSIFSEDEKLIYSGGSDRLIKVWDAGTGQLIRAFDGHNAAVTSLVLSRDGKMLISNSLDGVIKFWDLSTGREFFEHIHIAERDWLVKNRDGYFSGTEGALKWIHFVQGVNTFSVDQFYNEYYRPDLMPKSFQQRGAEPGKGLQGKLKDAPPPSLKLALVPADSASAEVMVKLINTGSGVRNLRLFHNGKIVPVEDSEVPYPARAGSSAVFRKTIKLVGGLNSLSAVVSNRDNVDSDRVSVEHFSESGPNNSRCHILAIGINKYKNQQLNLNYARPDATSFGNLIEANSRALFREVAVHALFDDEATREKILSKLDELRTIVKQDDVFMLYYAGHGSMVDSRFYFISTNNLRLYEEGQLRREAIEASVIQEKLKHIPALKQLIIMDACQSGGSVELLATRGANEEKAIAQLSRSTGIHVLASAGSEQFAAEFAELGHGLFTWVLLKALSGEADGAPRDGKVTIYELKSFIDDQVPEVSRKLKGKPQYPYTFSRGNDFPLVIRP